ncbi:hypothetical protein [Rubellicoccus peritrichatus]|uniref:Uncharacterized protein n=1 Tax=Rubellicoccus peritrichatus TaxID=3080537 RepID=A0AAQ3QUB9_9BACT|nr:hypothetical protein [Puniceicoccus sp. CR14]WOO40308.1 hypothetical protein RZN69_16940 [Puniceicoccus sp. CR14]
MKHQKYVYDKLCRDLSISILSMLIAPVCLTGVTLEVSTFSSGSVSSSPGGVTLNSSLGSVGGQSTVGTTIMRSGYPGQLFEIDSIDVEIPGGGIAEVADNATLQLDAKVTNTDGTTYSASNLAAWSSGDAHIDSVVSGLVRPLGVGADTAATIAADYFGESANLGLTVLDIDKDNFITSPYNFAGDGIPDDWQLANFSPGSGYASPEASPALDGRVNFFKYYFDLNATTYDLSSVTAATTVMDGGETYAAVTFRRAEEVPSSIVPQVIFGDNVAVTENQRIGLQVLPNIDNGDGTVTETWRDAVPISTTAFSTVDLTFNAP